MLTTLHWARLVENIGHTKDMRITVTVSWRGMKTNLMVEYGLR